MCVCLTLLTKHAKVDAGTASQSDHTENQIQVSRICKIFTIASAAKTGYCSFHRDFITAFVQSIFYSILPLRARMGVCL